MTNIVKLFMEKTQLRTPFISEEKIIKAWETPTCLQCKFNTDWNMKNVPCCMHAKIKLILQAILDGMSFSCGTPLQELDLPSYNVFIHSMSL